MSKDMMNNESALEASVREVEELERVREARAANEAQIIREQIGGRGLFMMGAKRYLFGRTASDCTYIQFKIGRNSKRVNMIRITLEHNDTYTVDFFRVGRVKVTELGTDRDVYVDNLRCVLESGTGMYLSL